MLKLNTFLTLLISVSYWCTITAEISVINESDIFTHKKCIRRIWKKLLQEHPDHSSYHGTYYDNTGAVNITGCCIGYKPYKFNSSICVPDCGDKCLNGYCVGPNQCQCFPGFVQINKEFCTYQCPLGCLNGRCDPRSNHCICNDGFTISHDNKYCIPKCDKCNLSQNKNCSAPNYCICKKGYEMQPDGHCKPKCNDDCRECSSPNRCTQCLHADAILDNGVCKGICKKDVLCPPDGYCDSNGFCHCGEGYIYHQDSKTCIPKCDVDCGAFGVCAEPNKCRCFKGYGQYLFSGPCIPVCDPKCCRNPGECNCNVPRHNRVLYQTIKQITPSEHCLTP